MLGALSVTTVALAATGVLSLGGPARFGASVQPHAGSGVAVPGSVRLLAVRTADPDGGPRWGMRTTRTTRGAVCLTVGRVLDGRLGALGIDGAFGDDDLLHPFTAGLFDAQLCAVPDADGHAFLSQAATGYPAAATGFYLVAHAGGCRASLQGLRGDCASSRLRDLYYGLLGPDAVSISYRTPSGAVRSEPTTGPDGAYLLVLPYRHGPKGGTISGELTGMTGPIVKFGLRGGRVCRPAPTVNCGAIGERAPGAPELTARDVRAPVHVQAIHARAYCQSPDGALFIACAHRVPRGFSRIPDLRPGVVLLNVRTIARQAVRTPASTYVLDVVYSHSPTCFSQGGGTPIDRDVRKGQRFLMQTLVPADCSGPVHGWVSYMMPSGKTEPDVSPTRSLTVGRFAIDPDPRR
jgi:hypothetical protein